MFSSSSVDLEILRTRANNLRWANVPPGVIPLTAADPDFPCAPEIREAICRHVESGYLCYGAPQGLSEFKVAMSQYFHHKRNLVADPSMILPVDSAAFAIYITCKAFLKAGDEAIIFDPVDFLFRYSVEQAGAVAVPFGIPPGQAEVDFEHLEHLINARTRMICLCNPLNPTGKVFTRSELIILGDIACRHDLVILSDEIWSDIVFKPNVFTSIASLNDEVSNRTVTITGFSKSFGLAGLRVGVLQASNSKHFERIYEASLHASTVHGCNILGQVAATAALNECQYWFDGFLNHLQRMRDLCVTELNNIQGFQCYSPAGCYVAFANITATGKTSQDIHQLLFDDARVAVVPGLKEWFGEGAEGFIRLSFATSEDILRTALGRIKNTINSL